MSVVMAPKKEKAPTQWRFPKDILKDEQFCVQIKQFLATQYLQIDKNYAWELIKHDICNITREKTRFRKKQYSSELTSLRQSLHAINKRIYAGKNLEQDRLKLQKEITNKEQTLWE